MCYCKVHTAIARLAACHRLSSHYQDLSYQAERARSNYVRLQCRWPRDAKVSTQMDNLCLFQSTQNRVIQTIELHNLPHWIISSPSQVGDNVKSLKSWLNLYKKWKVLFSAVAGFQDAVDNQTINYNNKDSSPHNRVAYRLKNNVLGFFVVFLDSRQTSLQDIYFIFQFDVSLILSLWLILAQVI